IWNLELPISLKKDLMIWAQNLIQDSSFDLSTIEYVYNTYSHMIKPDCTSEDVWYLNKHEFTQTIKKMYQADIKRPINNMEGLIKTWLQSKIHYKMENYKDSMMMENILKENETTYS